MSFHHSREWSGTPIARVGRLGRLVLDVLAGLDALYRAQYAAPWEVQRRPRR